MARAIHDRVITLDTHVDIDPRNFVAHYDYDGFGQLWQYSHPDTGTTTQIWNTAGQRTIATLGRLDEAGGQVEALQALMNIFMDADAAADVLGQTTPQGMVDAIRRHF